MADRRRRRETPVGTLPEAVRPSRCGRRRRRRVARRGDRPAAGPPTALPVVLCETRRGRPQGRGTASSGFGRGRSPAGSRPPARRSRTGCVNGVSRCPRRACRPCSDRRRPRVRPPALAAQAAALPYSPRNSSRPPWPPSRTECFESCCSTSSRPLLCIALSVGLAACAALAAAPNRPRRPAARRKPAPLALVADRSRCQSRPTRSRCPRARTRF